MGTAYYLNNKNWKDGLLYIGNHLIASDGSKAKGELTISDNTKVIADEAFALNDKITGVKVSNATTIGSKAFFQCTKLKTADVKANTIAANAFEGCTALGTVKADAKTIAESAFNGCTALKSAEIASAEKIGASAFEGCSSLESVSLPASLQLIGNKAFYGCTALENVEFEGSKTDKDNMIISTGNGSIKSAEWDCKGGEGDNGDNFFQKIINAIKGFFQKIIDAISNLFKG